MVPKRAAPTNSFVEVAVVISCPYKWPDLYRRLDIEPPLRIDIEFLKLSTKIQIFQMTPDEEMTKIKVVVLEKLFELCCLQLFHLKLFTVSKCCLKLNI
jgi:hypothetical protein